MANIERTGVFAHTDESTGNVVYLYPEVKTDTTLTVAGKAADAAAVGDVLNDFIPINLIPFPYYDTSHVNNEIRWVVRSDGTIEAFGSNPLVYGEDGEPIDFTIINVYDLDFKLPNGDYTIFGCPAGGQIWVKEFNPKTGTVEEIVISGPKQCITLTKKMVNNGMGELVEDPDFVRYIGIGCRIGVGTQISGRAVFKPMIVKGFVDLDLVDSFSFTKGVNNFQNLSKLSKKLKVMYEDTFSENLIPFPYDDENGIVKNGVTWTYDEDGVIYANGETTGDSVFYLHSYSNLENAFSLKSGTYVLTGGKGDLLSIEVGYLNENEEYVSIATNTGNGVIFNINKNIDNVQIQVSAKSGAVLNNEEVRVMLVNGDESAPYHRSFDSVYELNKRMDNISEDTAEIAEMIEAVNNNKSTVHICENQPSEMKSGDLYFIITE